ncbi:hypothetical protein BG000_008987, partial [Podila horticola]
MASRIALQHVLARRSLVAASSSRTAAFSTMTKALHQHQPSQNNNANAKSEPETHFGFQNVPENMKEAL